MSYLHEIKDLSELDALVLSKLKQKRCTHPMHWSIRAQHYGEKETSDQINKPESIYKYNINMP